MHMDKKKRFQGSTCYSRIQKLIYLVIFHSIQNFSNIVKNRSAINRTMSKTPNSVDIDTGCF